MGTKRKRGESYPVEYVASELGIDRKALIRRLESTGVDYSNGIKFREAMAAWIAKDERDADRARRQKAEADSAEMDAANKLGQLMLKRDATIIWADATIEIRKLIQSQDKWDSNKLLVALSKIKPEKT